MTTTFLRAATPVPLTFPSPGTVRLAVAGEVGLATAPMLGMRLLSVMDAHHPAALDVDLAEVTFLDCSGIGVLVAVRNTAERTGCQMRISHPQPMVALILDVVGLLGLFTAPIVLAEPPPAYFASLMRPWSRVVRTVLAMVGRIAT